MGLFRALTKLSSKPTESYATSSKSKLTTLNHLDDKDLPGWSPAPETSVGGCLHTFTMKTDRLLLLVHVR